MLRIDAATQNPAIQQQIFDRCMQTLADEAVPEETLDVHRTLQANAAALRPPPEWENPDFVNALVDGLIQDYEKQLRGMASFPGKLHNFSKSVWTTAQGIIGINRTR